MKKFHAVILSLLLLLSLTACGSGSDSGAVSSGKGEDGSVLSPNSGAASSPDTSTPDTSNPDIPDTTDPAQLQGVWLQVGSEVEGDINPTMPYFFNSMIFQTDGGDALLASAQSGDYDGFTARDSYSQREVTLLDQPIYEGCGNDEWSVRIGEESPLNEHGYPTGVDIYVTLLDENTLLQQRYYSFDNGQIPGVSYQTYKRFLPGMPNTQGEAALAGGNFELAGYINADGVRQETHPVYTDFRLHLNTAGGYTFTSSASDNAQDDYTGGGHYWGLGEGGTILLRSENLEQDGFGGVVTEDSGVTEILLWDNMEGILCLQYKEWDGYQDTMTDLEGNAFAAPANAVLIYYGDEYLDMDWYRDNEGIPVYELADGPDVRKILISCAVDDTPVWIENDGFEVGQLGTMMAGESIIVQTGYDGAHLCFKYGGIEYYIELSNSSLPLDKWDYITV